MSGGIYSREQIAESAQQALAKHGDKAAMQNPFTSGSVASDAWLEALHEAQAAQQVVEA